MKKGFGAATLTHRREFRHKLAELARSLHQAEGYHRNGLCYPLMEEAATAFRIAGEVEEHRKYVSAGDRKATSPEWIKLGTRLNFLRQHMKSCIEPGSD